MYMFLTKTFGASWHRFLCRTAATPVMVTEPQQQQQHPFNGPFSGTTQVSRYQKGKTNLDFTEARDSEWQWHQLGRIQVCTLLQTVNHASTPPLSFLQAGCPSCPRASHAQSAEMRPVGTCVMWSCGLCVLSVEHNHKPYKIGWTDRDAIFWLPNHSAVEMKAPNYHVYNFIAVKLLQSSWQLKFRVTFLLHSTMSLTSLLINDCF